MKADYTVRLTGKDDLSKTIKNVQKELLDVGKATSNIDKINEKFERITKSSAPLKRQLSDLQNLIAQMNLDKLQNTDVFIRIAEEAGRVNDAIKDAAEATKRFSSDTFKLDALIQGFQGVAAVTSIATGAMALFGTENKDVQKAILKVQATLSILNGVQSVANMLNKDSVLMLRLKQIRMAASAAATTVETTAVGANTVAVASNTAAMRAWNTAKAVGKALFGDWTGLLLIGVTSMAAYSVATSKSSDTTEDLTKSTKEAAEAQRTFVSTLSNTYAGLMTKYTQLQAEWKKLSNAHQKAEWINNNKSKLDELEVSVNNVADAEKVFNGGTDAVVQSFVRRAKAAARLAQLTELYKKQIELIDKIQTDAAKHGRSARAGDEITDATFRNSRYGSVNSQGKWIFSEQGAKLYSGTDTSSNQELKKLNKQIGLVIDAIEDESKTPVRYASTPSTNRTTRTSTPSTTTTTTPKAEKEIRVDDSLARQAERQWDQRINKIEQLQDRYNNLQRSQTTSTFDMYVGGNSDVMSNIQSQMNFNDSLLRQLKSIKQGYADLGLEGSEAYKEIAKEIFSVSLEQMNLGNQAQQIDKQTKKLEEQTKTWGEIGDAASATAGLISQFGEMSDDKGLQTAGIIAETIANILLGYSQATAQASSLGPFGWAAFAIAGLAQVASMIAQIHSLSGYAEGGIVGGDSTHGDTILARLNTGEMVLNKRQQRNLFNVLDNGGVGGGYTESTVKIKGSDLYLAMKNYKGVKNKTGLKTF